MLDGSLSYDSLNLNSKVLPPLRLFILALALSTLPSAKTVGQRRPSNAVTVIDSQMSREAALKGSEAPPKLLSRMEVVSVLYNGFDGKTHQGQIVVDRSVAGEVKEIFEEIRASGYPIAKVIPIVKYRWKDQESILDNNTSAFNYRTVIVPGQRSNKLSGHSFGRAIDLNPKLNPFVSADGKSSRPYDPRKPGTLTLHSRVTQIFLKHGWIWGGSWKGGRDYQHFSKPG